MFTIRRLGGFMLLGMATVFSSLVLAQDPTGSGSTQTGAASPVPTNGTSSPVGNPTLGGNLTPMGPVIIGGNATATRNAMTIGNLTPMGPVIIGGNATATPNALIIANATISGGNATPSSPGQTAPVQGGASNATVILGNTTSNPTSSAPAPPSSTGQ